MPSSTTTSTTFDRGAALSAVLVVATLSHALVLTLLATSWVQAVGQGQPAPAFLPISVAGAVATLVAYAGLWTGHRWAFWLLVAMIVIAVLIKVAVEAPSSVMLLQTALQLLLCGAVLRRWSSFS
jgi:hypothetical protein